MLDFTSSMIHCPITQLQSNLTIKLFSFFLENQMSSAPITYHRMDVLPEAKTCYYTDTVSYAGTERVQFTLSVNSVATKIAN